MIATRLGVQRITGITIFDTKEKKAYDPLPDLEVCKNISIISLS